MSRKGISLSVVQKFFRSLDDTDAFVELFRHLDNVHFYVKNRRGEFMTANRPSLLRNGIRTEADIIGKTDFDFHPPEMAEAYRAEDRLVMVPAEPCRSRCGWCMIT